MIEFLTLFLGLATGVHPVAVAVTGPVAAVELRLDGEVVATLAGPPWRTEVDFGPLAPRELVAVALGRGGGELGRAVARVNSPTSPAEARLLLERDGSGRAVAARLTWRSAGGAAPVRFQATFDDQPLTVVDPARIPLPDHDPGRIHFLQVELEFPREVRAEAGVSFGGTFVDRVVTELTAVPVLAEGRRPLPAAEELRGWFVKGNEPLTAVAVDAGPAQVIFVEDLEAPGCVAPLFPSPNRWPEWLALGPEHQARSLSPLSRPVAEGDGLSTHVFPQTGGYPSTTEGLYALLSGGLQLATDARRQRLAEAVAVAGLEAAGSNRRRAVVLVLGPEPLDRSGMDPAAVRRYLEDLRVPLIVWQFLRRAGDRPAREWGEVQTIVSPGELRRALAHLRDTLDRQRIVWLDGSHLPHQVELSPRAGKVQLAR